MDSTASYWEGFNKALFLRDEEVKALKEKLDRTEKQRNALINALNYINNTIISMSACSEYNPEYTEGYYLNAIDMMERIMKEALLMAVDNSEDTIKLEVKEDDI